MDIASLGIAIDSTDADRASVDLDKLSQAGARTEEAAKKVGRVWQDAMKQFSAEIAGLGSKMDSQSGTQAQLLVTLERLSVQLANVGGRPNEPLRL